MRHPGWSIVKINLKHGGKFIIGALVNNDKDIEEYNDLLCLVMERRRQKKEATRRVV